MKLIQSTFAVAFSTLVLTGCGADDKPAEAEGAETTKAATTSIDTKSYKVGVVPDFEPYSFRGAENELAGFNIDLTDAIAQAQGFKVEYLDKPWSPTFDSVQSEKVDFIASIVTITPERDEMIDFSKPYITSSVDAAVIDELKDRTFNQLIDDESLKYGIMANTRFYDYALDLGVDPGMIKQSPTSFTSLTDVFNGNVDVTMADGNTLKYFKKQYPAANLVSNPTDVAEYAYVVKTGDTEMQKVLNDGLAQVKASGQYDKIHAKWFGK